MSSRPASGRPQPPTRDEEDKPRADELAGAPSTLTGYRRGPLGEFERWPTDAGGRWWSDVLGLFFVVCGSLLQTQTPDGQVLLTPEQTEEARRDLDAEVERLRRDLERFGRGRKE